MILKMTLTSSKTSRKKVMDAIPLYLAPDEVRRLIREIEDKCDRDPEIANICIQLRTCLKRYETKH